MTDRQGKFSLTFILVSFVVLSWAYGLAIPPFENLDEVEHFSAIRYVAETGSLPVHDPAIQEQYHYRQEASQPPLYYMLMGGLTRLLDLPTEDTNTYLVKNPFVACGSSDNPYNKNALYHNPSQESFSLDKLGTPPWDGALLTLHLLRALSPFLQVVTIIGVYAIARLIFPQRPGLAILAAGLTAFNPQFLSVASGVNNDNLVTPLATLGLYLALVVRQRGLSLRRSIALGVLAGLAGLSKLSGLLLLGLIGVVLLEAGWRSGRLRSVLSAREGLRSVLSAREGLDNDLSVCSGWGQSIVHGLLIGSVTAIVCGWWFWRNWQLYGDPTALEPMLELVGRRASSTIPLNESGLMFRSFWGQLACAFFSDWFYWFFGLLTAIGLTGLIAGLISGRKSRRGWSGMLLLALWFGLVYVGWLRWGSITAATGGRLLFPAIASTSVLLAYGLTSLWPQVWRTRVATVAVVLLGTVALATLLWELRPLFASPKTFERADAPAIPHPLEATFAPVPSEQVPLIGMHGYGAELSDAGPYLDVTLYWEALASISQDYALTIQLTSPVPGDDSLRLNYNTWPGRGNYPTTAWTPGRVIADHYRLKLPASETPTQAWELLVAFYDTGSGERLSAHQNGHKVGRGLVLTALRVPGLPPDCPADPILDRSIYFGQQSTQSNPGMIALTGAAVRPQPSPTDPGLQVSLCWESLAPTPIDYTVFVHLYDERGELLATGDGPPVNGAFPTRLWQPGDRAIDAHLIRVTDEILSTIGDYRVGIGLYDLNSGQRLPAWQAGQPLPDAVVLLEMGP
jgi:hypothetical protein